MNSQTATSQQVNFEKFAQEGNEFVNRLAERLGHPEEQARTLTLLRAVLHAVRDRITVAESFHLMSQLPLLLRGIYTEQWEYAEKPPKRFDSIEEMKDEVKKGQSRFGEEDFPWKASTEQLIASTLSCLRETVTSGQLDHVCKQMPKEVQELF